LLIEVDGAEEGKLDMAIRQQAAQEQGDPTLNVE
jgi:hypothetical protein